MNPYVLCAILHGLILIPLVIAAYKTKLDDPDEESENDIY